MPSSCKKSISGPRPRKSRSTKVLIPEIGHRKPGVERTWRTPMSDRAVLGALDETGLYLVGRRRGESATATPDRRGHPPGGELAGTYPNPTVSVLGRRTRPVPVGAILPVAGSIAPGGWLSVAGPP